MSEKRPISNVDQTLTCNDSNKKKAPRVYKENSLLCINDDIWKVILSFCFGTKLRLGQYRGKKPLHLNAREFLFMQMLHGKTYSVTLDEVLCNVPFVSKEFKEKVWEYIHSNTLELINFDRDFWIKPMKAFEFNISMQPLKLGYIDLSSLQISDARLLNDGDLKPPNESILIASVIFSLFSFDLSKLKKIKLPDATKLPPMIDKCIADLLSNDEVDIYSNEVLQSDARMPQLHRHIEANPRTQLRTKSLEYIEITSMSSLYLPILEAFTATCKQLKIVIDTDKLYLLPEIERHISNMKALTKLDIQLSSPMKQNVQVPIKIIISTSLKSLSISSPSSIHESSSFSSLERLSLIAPLEQFNAKATLSSCLNSLRSLKMNLLLQYGNTTSSTQNSICKNLTDFIRCMSSLEELDLRVETRGRENVKLDIESNTLEQISLADGGEDRLYLEKCTCPSLRVLTTDYDPNEGQMTIVKQKKPFQKNELSPRWNYFSPSERDFIGLSIPQNCRIQFLVPFC
ncbi:predicted protein [Chaetoceros tenuissimus]|uniref:Uncharacterized protein n=1 Tax=Chaetoceros tenuissimus TaxID=426638 RepID=A0AAD3CLR7_9STRA|nr:predicted protein [Chaetoceros tenuissimus]